MSKCKGCPYWKWVKADKLYQTPGHHYCERTTCIREKKSSYVIKWDSVSGDGYRVKHRMMRDENRPECFWHIETRLTNDPVTLGAMPFPYEVYPRQFFGKVWIAQRIEYKRATTWKAIGEAVRQLELKEKLIV